MEINYPKDYELERTESDEMRSKSIKEYYEKEAIKKEQKEKIKNKVLLVLVIVIILIFLYLKFIKLI